MRWPRTCPDHRNPAEAGRGTAPWAPASRPGWTITRPRCGRRPARRLNRSPSAGSNVPIRPKAGSSIRRSSRGCGRPGRARAATPAPSRAGVHVPRCAGVVRTARTRDGGGRKPIQVTPWPGTGRRTVRVRSTRGTAERRSQAGAGYGPARNATERGAFQGCGLLTRPISCSYINHADCLRPGEA